MEARVSRRERQEAVDGLWDLPEGWTWHPLGGLGTWTGGGTPSKATPHYWSGGSIPWVSPKDMKADVIGATEDMITPAAVDESAAKYVAERSILMVMRSGILRHSFPIAVTDRVVTVNQDLRALTPFSGVNPSFVSHYLKFAARRILEECSKDGTTVNSVEVPALERFPVPIAPREEQQRIDTRIDQLFAEIAEGERALAEARKNLEKFRRALLKAAVTGELTKDWRDANPVTESGHDLLDRIAKSRSARGPAKGRGRRSTSAEVQNETDLPTLPEGWAWAVIDQLKLSDQRNGISIAGSVAPPGVKAMRLDSLTSRGLDLDAVRFIPLPEDRIADYRVNAGDLLISRANGSAELVGRAVYVREIDQTVVFPDTIIRYPLDRSEQQGGWAELVWNSPFGRSQIRRLAKTTAGILKISQRDISQVKIPIPPPAEAAEIIRRVSEGLAAADDTLALLDAEAADAARLKQSILKAAFEGRLVPQVPADEPASALLARILVGVTPTARKARGRPRKGL